MALKKENRNKNKKEISQHEQKDIKYQSKVNINLFRKSINAVEIKRNLYKVYYSKRRNINNKNNRERRIWLSILSKLARSECGHKKIYKDKRISKSTYLSFYRRSSNYK